MSYFAIYMIGLFFNIVFSFRKYFYLIELDPTSEEKIYRQVQKLRLEADTGFEDKIKIFILPFSYVLEYFLFKNKAYGWLKQNEDKKIIDFYISYLEYQIKQNKQSL